MANWLGKVLLSKLNLELIFVYKDPNYHKKYYEENKEYYLVYQRKFRQSPEGKKCRQDYYLTNNQMILHKQHTYQKNIRYQLFDVLGHTCVKCGFVDKRALQIDHINGGGMEDRKNKGSATAMYKYYVEHPELAKERLQVLCANCNWIKRSEWKEYPNQKKFS